MRILTEGKAKFYATKAGIVSRDMPVFYNPIMKLNRDIAIAIIAAADKNKIRIADPLAGSGVRSLRFLLELERSKILSVSINDVSPTAVKIIKRNLKLNKQQKKATVTNKEANKFLLESTGFDYIDIDPFGCPGAFIDSALRRIANKGILAVTATDTAALAGTAPKACMRKYWAVPLRNELMHETGLRILIRRVQLVAASMEKAAIPIFSYFKDHYARAFFMVERGSRKTDNILKEHKHYYYCNGCLERSVISAKIGKCGRCCSKNVSSAGPIWAGRLWEGKLVKKMADNCIDETSKKFLKTIAHESPINTIGFYDIHKLSKMLKIGSVPSMSKIIKELGNPAAVTHFNSNGIRTTASIKKVIDAVRKII